MSAVTTVAFAGAGLAACSDGGGNPSPAPPSTGTTAVTSAARGGRMPIVIKTQFTGFDGKVLAGSLIGDSPFCSGGTLHHESGSPEIGHPAINVLTCGANILKIGFGPGPDQMNNRIQTSDWDVVGGRGDFAGMTGSGHMKVEFPKVGASRGQETFIGTVVLP